MIAVRLCAEPPEGSSETFRREFVCVHVDFHAAIAEAKAQMPQGWRKVWVMVEKP